MIYKRHHMNIYVNKRDDILIKNNFKVVENNNFSDTFHIVCYYISQNICKIIVRRTNCNEGWGQNLMIVIEDIENNNYEEYSIGSSNSNIKILELYVKIRLFKTIYTGVFHKLQQPVASPAAPHPGYSILEDQRDGDIQALLGAAEYNIPKVIIQTYDEAIYKNNTHYNAVISLIELNPEYEYKFFDNNDCLKFISENYDKEILHKYNSIKTYKKKSELFRYCYLYLNGGCYINSNINIIQPIHKIINNDDNFAVSDGNDNRIIMTYSKNELLYKLINNFDNTPEIGSLRMISGGLTEGCGSLRKTLINIEKNSSLHKIINNIHFKIINDIKIKNVLVEENIIFKKSIKINNYIFQIFQSIEEDDFEIVHLKNNIYYIQRIDKNEGWSQNITLRILNDLENINIEINIRNSDKNKKIFIIG